MAGRHTQLLPIYLDIKVLRPEKENIHFISFLEISKSQPVILDIYLYGESVIIIHEAGLGHGAAGPVHDGGGGLLTLRSRVGEAETRAGRGDGQYAALGQ